MKNTLKTTNKEENLINDLTFTFYKFLLLIKNIILDYFN